MERYEYDAYGNTHVFDAEGAEIGRSAIGNRYCFQGRPIDWDTGLYNFRARWYDPDTGRWLSKDPIGISGGLNQYEFVYNNPVNYIDPKGLSGGSSAASWYQHVGPPPGWVGDVADAIGAVKDTLTGDPYAIPKLLDGKMRDKQKYDEIDRLRKENERLQKEIDRLENKPDKKKSE